MIEPAIQTRSSFLGQGPWRMTVLMNPNLRVEFTILVGLLREIEARNPGVFDDAPIRFAPPLSEHIGLDVQGTAGLAGHVIETVCQGLNTAQVQNLWLTIDMPAGSQHLDAPPHYDDPEQQRLSETMQQLQQQSTMPLVPRAAWMERLRASTAGTHEPASENEFIQMNALCVGLTLLDGEILSAIAPAYWSQTGGQQLSTQTDKFLVGAVSVLTDEVLPGVRAANWAALPASWQERLLAPMSVEARQKLQATLSPVTPPRPSRRFN